MSTPATSERLADAIDAWLPQTQCTRCGYPRCLDYARAVADGEADINQCPPGGNPTIEGIAGLLERAPKPLDTTFGEHQPKVVARIDEPRCIGCTLCIQACPVDAIAGASKQMHTVIESECTGCELCLPACPVDCIDLLPAAVPHETGASPWSSPWPEYSPEQTETARRRTRARIDRLNRRERELRLDKLHRQVGSEAGRARIKDDIAAAITRVQARRQHRRYTNHE